MPQIQKGDTFADGQQVTGARLNQLIDSATILPNIITDQTNIAVNGVASDDSLLVYDLSATALREANVSDVLGSNVPVTTSQITAGNTSDVTISPQNGTLVAGLSFTSADGLTVVVTSNAHGLVAGQVVTTTASTVAGYNGTHKITAVTTDTFTYVMTVAGTIGSGTISYTKQGVVKITANEVISNNLYVDGNAVITGNSNIIGDVINDVKFTSTGAIKIPAGTTAQRPQSPVQGQLRYNTTTSTTEVYKGTSWESVGGSPFDATGGNTVIAPDKVITSATFVSTDGAKVVVTSNLHTVYIGTTVAFETSISGYSGTWTVKEITTNTFTFWMDIARTPVSTATGCTYNKNFKYKTHIFTSSGTFTPTNLGTFGEVEVLVVGGGGDGAGVVFGSGQSSQKYCVGGGGGGVLYLRNYKINSLSPINVVVGSSNADSSFGTLIAYKGGIPFINTNGGGWTSSRYGKSGGTNLGQTSKDGGAIHNSNTGGNVAPNDSQGGGALTSGRNFYSQPYLSGMLGIGYVNEITGKPTAYGFGWHPSINEIENYGTGGIVLVAYPYNGTVVQPTAGIVVVRYPWIPS